MSDLFEDFDRLTTGNATGTGLLESQARYAQESETGHVSALLEYRGVPSEQALARHLRRQMHDPALRRQLDRLDTGMETDEIRTEKTLKTMAIAGAAAGAGAAAMPGTAGAIAGAAALPALKIGLATAGGALIPMLAYLVWRKLRAKAAPIIQDAARDPRRRSYPGFYEAVGEARPSDRLIDATRDATLEVLQLLRRRLKPEEMAKLQKLKNLKDDPELFRKVASIARQV